MDAECTNVVVCHHNESSNLLACNLNALLCVCILIAIPYSHYVTLYHSNSNGCTV